jgi:TonB family protein
VSAWFWEELGLSPGADRDTVRRAYSRKLRIANPEDDPEGFKRLREAYELAQRFAARDARAEADATDSGPSALPPERSFRGEIKPPRSRRATTKTPVASEELPLDERALERRAFESLRQSFARSLRADGDSEQGVELIRQLLAAPAMDELLVRASTEEWLAGQLAKTLPRSEALIDPAARYFGWGSNDYRRHSPAVAALLRQQHHHEQLRSERVALTLPEHELHGGWRALTDGPRAPWLLRLQALRPGLPDQVRVLVRLARTRLRGLDERFDRQRLQWWDGFLARPRVTFGTMLLVPLVWSLLLMAIAAAQGGEISAFDLLLALIAATASAVLYIAYLKRLPLDRLQPTAGWRLAWIAAPALFPIAAMFVPRDGTGTAIVVALALISLGVVLAFARRIIMVVPMRALVLHLARHYWLIGLFASLNLGSMPVVRSGQWQLVAAISALNWHRGSAQILTDVGRRFDFKPAIALALVVVLMGATGLFAMVSDPQDAVFRVSLAALVAFAIIRAVPITTREFRLGNAYTALALGFTLLAWFVVLSSTMPDRSDTSFTSAVPSQVPLADRPQVRPVLPPAPLPAWKPIVCPPIKRDGPLPAPPTQCGSSNLLIEGDYPEDALRRGASGRTAIEATIGVDGRLSGCRVKRSSGDAALDAATCRLIIERARFLPALDRKGRPQTASFRMAVTWKIRTGA